MFECSSCKKTLDEETNFCPRCGTKQQIKNRCPICLESKELVTLICGHNTCIVCINNCYKEKKECPICRSDIQKCINCYNFRIVTMMNKSNKCLDCKAIIKKNTMVKQGEKITCIDCKSARVLYNPLDQTYNCNDCFNKFNSDLSDIITTTPLTKICMICFSNNIEYLDYAIAEGRLENYVDKNMCNNCEKKNVETMNITLEEYSKLTVKKKREVNTDIIKICPKCDSKDIYSLETTVNKMYDCNNCEGHFFIPKIVEC